MGGENVDKNENRVRRSDDFNGDFLCSGLVCLSGELRGGGIVPARFEPLPELCKVRRDADCDDRDFFHWKKSDFRAGSQVLAGGICDGALCGFLLKDFAQHKRTF